MRKGRDLKCGIATRDRDGLQIIGDDDNLVS